MERELVDRAKRGDEEAFDALARQVGDRCMTIASWILRDTDRAEDAVQATFVRAWRDLRTLRDADRFEPWLHRILTNECYAETRRRRRWSAFAGPHLVVLGYAGPFAGDLAAFVQDRTAATARDHSDTCPSNALQLTQATTIGGEPGVLLALNCGARIDQAITVHDGVGYAFTIRDTAFSSTLDPTDFASVRSMLDLLIFPVAPVGSP